MHHRLADAPIVMDRRDAFEAAAQRAVPQLAAAAAAIALPLRVARVVGVTAQHDPARRHRRRTTTATATPATTAATTTTSAAAAAASASRAVGRGDLAEVVGDAQVERKGARRRPPPHRPQPDHVRHRLRGGAAEDDQLRVRAPPHHLALLAEAAQLERRHPARQRHHVHLRRAGHAHAEGEERAVGAEAWRAATALHREPAAAQRRRAGAVVVRQRGKPKVALAHEDQLLAVQRRLRRIAALVRLRQHDLAARARLAAAAAAAVAVAVGAAAAAARRLGVVRLVRLHQRHRPNTRRRLERRPLWVRAAKADVLVGERLGQRGADDLALALELRRRP